MLFNFRTRLIDYEHLSFQFLSQDLSPYKIFISNYGQPSSSNTFKLRPAWINGYIFDLRRTLSSVHFQNQLCILYHFQLFLFL